MSAGEPSPRSAGDLLKAGIAAARAGQRENAQELLTRVVQMDDRNVAGWLWLSSVVDDLSHREMCLQHVLELDPGNDPARRGLEKVRRHKLEELLREGISAAQKGQRDHARELLKQYVEVEESSIAAWLWLSSVVNTLGEREICLENVLVLEPDNEAAQRGLAKVREQMELERQVAPTVTLTPLEPASPVTVDVGGEADLDTAGLLAYPSTPRDEFDDEYRCPYCATLTDPKDTKCPSCRAELWVRRRKREERSSWFWVAWTLEIASALVILAVLAVLLMVVAGAVRLGFGLDIDLGKLLQIYFGLIGGTEEVAEAALSIVPRWIFFVILGASIFQVGVVVTMLLRWRPTWYFFLLSAVSGLITSVLALSRVGMIGWIVGGVALLISFGIVWLAFQIQDDFFFDWTRILLRPDREARSGVDHLAHGSRYARTGMWAMAVVHLQRAAAAMPDRLEPQLALASAYIRLKHYERAAEALAGGRRISPDDPQVAEVAALLERVQAG